MIFGYQGINTKGVTASVAPYSLTTERLTQWFEAGQLWSYWPYPSSYRFSKFIAYNRLLFPYISCFRSAPKFKL